FERLRQRQDVRIGDGLDGGDAEAACPDGVEAGLLGQLRGERVVRPRREDDTRPPEEQPPRLTHRCRLIKTRLRGGGRLYRRSPSRVTSTWSSCTRARPPSAPTCAQRRRSRTPSPASRSASWAATSPPCRRSRCVAHRSSTSSPARSSTWRWWRSRKAAPSRT